MDVSNQRKQGQESVRNFLKSKRQGRSVQPNTGLLQGINLGLLAGFL